MNRRRPRRLDKARKELGRIRAGIDAIDDAIVRRLARRKGLSLRLARVKRALGVPIYDRRREAALLGRVRSWGGRHALGEEFVEVVFRLILMHSKEVQYRQSL